MGGVAVLLTELGILKQKFALEIELTEACNTIKKKNSQTKILAFAPTRTLNPLIDFSAESIRNSTEEGFRLVNNTEPQDLCAWLAFHRTSRDPEELNARDSRADEEVVNAEPQVAQPTLRDVLRQEQSSQETVFRHNTKHDLDSAEMTALRDAVQHQPRSSFGACLFEVY